MLPSDPIYQAYVNILKEELLPATGCTEPIAIAYCAASAHALLGMEPDRIQIDVSGNIIKNVKSVVVPGTGGLKGIQASIAVGIVAGRAEEKLQVIAHVTPEDRSRMEDFLTRVPISVACADSPFIFDIDIRLYAGVHSARVRIVSNHTNIIFKQKDETVLLDLPATENPEEGLTDKRMLSVKDIVDFADTVHLRDISGVICRQIACNTAISDEGFQGDYGANIGSILRRDFGDDIKNRAKARAAAGSDARMDGCEMPVVILSGSGNQGMTASLPVIEYARELGVSDDMLYRALAVASLVTIHQKTGIGRLSAFCGATSAGCGAGAGIAYLHGGDYTTVAHTIVNALAILSGMICDGAKPSCAAKIASAVEAGILGYHMYVNGKEFYGGDGILKKGVDNTIANVGRMAREGMRETDKTILAIMTEE